MQVLVLADTHLRQGLEKMPAAVLAAVDASDVVLHAGDITARSTYEALRNRGGLRAVLGNNDHELVGLLPERLVFEVGGVFFGMIHDSGAKSGRPARLGRMFPTARVVVFGHSHIPVCEAGVGGQLLLNPGSPTQQRLQPHPTFGVLQIRNGQVSEARIESV